MAAADALRSSVFERLRAAEFPQCKELSTKSASCKDNGAELPGAAIPRRQSGRLLQERPGGSGTTVTGVL